MARSKAPPLNISFYEQFVTKFHAETDRAAAVLAGAFLDSLLEQFLRAILVEGSRTHKLFDAEGALSTFSSKIGLAFALGLATEAHCRDMDLVRKIRNYFAHHVLDATFDQSPVRDWCEAIGIVDASRDSDTGELVKFSGSPRDRYLLCVGISVLQLCHSPKLPPEVASQFLNMPGFRSQ